MTRNTIERTTTLRDNLRIIFRRKMTIVMAITVTMASVFIGLQLKTPGYESEVRMLFEGRKHIDSPYYRDAAEFRSSERILTQSELVKSNRVVERVVAHLGAEAFSPEYEKSFSTPLKAIVVDLIARKFRRALAKFPAEEQEAILLRSAVKHLYKQITVEPVRNTDIFIIRVRDFSPQRAAQLANAVSRSYSIFDMEQQLAELQRVYGEKHLFITHLREEIDLLEKTLGGEPLENEEAFSTATIKIIEQATYPTTPTDTPRMLVLLLASMLGCLIGAIIAFMIDNADTTFKSPEEIKGMAGNWSFLGYVPRLTSAGARGAGVLRLLSGILAGGIALVIFGRMLIEVLALDSDNALVRFFVSGTRLFGPQGGAAGQGEIPVKVMVVSSLTLIGGTILYVIGRNRIAQLIRSVMRWNMVMRPDRQPPEYVRSLRQLSETITLAMTQNGWKSAVVTSTLPQEGKTSFLVNLVDFLAAKTAFRILLVDANFRNPQLHNLFPLEHRVGFAHLLSGKGAPEEAVQRVNERLHVVHVGTEDGDPISSSTVTAVRKVMDAFKKQYDFIFIDGPDLKYSQDAAMIASGVDCALLVVQEGRVRREVFYECAAQLEHRKANILGVILTQRTFSIPRLLYEQT